MGLVILDVGLLFCVWIHFFSLQVYKSFLVLVSYSSMTLPFECLSLSRRYILLGRTFAIFVLIFTVDIDSKISFVFFVC